MVANHGGLHRFVNGAAYAMLTGFSPRWEDGQPSSLPQKMRGKVSFGLGKTSMILCPEQVGTIGLQWMGTRDNPTMADNYVYRVRTLCKISIDGLKGGQDSLL